MIKINGFNKTYSGLNNKEVRDSQYKYGKNELKPEKKLSFFTWVLTIFKEPMFILLFGTASIYFVLGEVSDGVIMLISVLFISAINLFQEWRTDKALQTLKDLTVAKVKVIRNNAIDYIDSKELTINDLMVLEEGDRISVDGEIIEMYDFGVDESALTGESKIVWKIFGDNEKNIFWRKDFCYAGTTVIQGRAIILVTNIGATTEYGKIGTDILTIPQQKTPLEKETHHLIKICAVIGGGLFLLVLRITYLTSKNFVESIMAGITLAMAIIPEEFPVILTVFLAMGAWRLAKKNSLIRKMPSIETLGEVSVLCVDKTGTLTENQMIVQELRSYKNILDSDLVYWAALGCEPEPFDPMEKAILKCAVEKGIDKNSIFNQTLVNEYPFSSETKMMGHIWKINNLNCLAAKGAPESILPLCNLSFEDNKNLRDQQELMSLNGYRVIAIARVQDMPIIPKEMKNNNLEFMGLIALMDPPRETVADAIKVCVNAGIHIVMITGDNGITAKSIANKIGIPGSDNVITGFLLDNMSDTELQKQLKNTNIFARVIPSHKLRLVKAFKDLGEVVAMTGDGVNDAPALKYADIGIAMGKRGTAVAKEASDMILLDDNFTTIIETIKDGRRIYDNIKKSFGYLFVIHIPIVLIALLTPLLDLPLFLLPIHIVLFELVVDPTCSIIFERCPVEKNIMDRKPRVAKDPLISTKLLTKSIIQGIVIFIVTFGTYWFFYNQTKASLLAQGVDVGKLLITLKGIELQNFMIMLTGDARTIALLTFILSNLLLVFVNQSATDYAITSMVHFKDKILWSINLVIVTTMILIIYTPYGNILFQTQPLNFYQTLLALALAIISTFWWEFIKLFKSIGISK